MCVVEIEGEREGRWDGKEGEKEVKGEIGMKGKKYIYVKISYLFLGKYL